MQWLATTMAARVAASHEDALDTLLRRRRRPGRDYARPAPGARRRRRGRAGEARRLPARLPRRHDPSSTLEVMHELGLLEAFLALPYTQVRELAGIIGGARIPIADFGRLPARCPF